MRAIPQLRNWRFADSEAQGHTVAQARNPATYNPARWWWAEGNKGNKGRPLLSGEFEATLGYTGLWGKNK